MARMMPVFNPHMFLGLVFCRLLHARIVFVCSAEQDDLNHLGMFGRLADIGCDLSKFGKAVWTDFLVVFQFDTAALFDDLHMGGRTVEESNRESHQRQVSGHGLPPWPAPITVCFLVIYSPILNVI